MELVVYYTRRQGVTLIIHALFHTLAHVTTHMTNSGPTTFGISNPAIFEIPGTLHELF